MTGCKWHAKMQRTSTLILIEEGMNRLSLVVAGCQSAVHENLMRYTGVSWKSAQHVHCMTSVREKARGCFSSAIANEGHRRLVQL